MMGYDMSMATFAIVEVMSHSRFGIKRPGYLASSLAFGDNTDVGLLTINLFKKDFGSKSQYEAGLALSCLSNICTQEISRSMITDITAMLSSSRAYLRKKTVLCLYRVLLKDSMSLVTCFPKLQERLGDEDQGVLTATVNTFLELARKNAKNYLSLVPQLYHILVNTNNNWLSIKLLKVFQLLCPLEARLPAKMVEPLTNILNTTKAQSVEFEAIRCTVRAMPEGSELMALALEKLRSFLNSSDRNLRYLALELFKEVLDLSQAKDKAITPDLHTKVLQSIEESDTTARKIALLLLDRIVTPSSFADTVKKLMEFSQNSSSDEFLGTILRMASRDRYALVEDFAWYLLVLAEMARQVDSSHGAQIAEQFVDISVRVAGVRPYAVTLALSLLDRGPSVEGRSAGQVGGAEGAGVVDIASAVVGACAWIIGEYHSAIDEPRDATFVKATRSLLEPKQVLSMAPAIQMQCIWAATKLYLNSAAEAPSAVAELYDILRKHLPAYAQSTHVDVSERAALVLQILGFFEADVGRASAGTKLFEEALLPVAPDAQAGVPLPPGLNLEENFFEPEVIPQETFAPVRADATDPYQLATNYKDDLGFLAAQEAQRKAAAAASSPDAAGSSMFYLGKGDAAGGSADTAKDASEDAQQKSLDPLAQMREKLEAQRASGGVRYEVDRTEFKPPSRPGASSPVAEVGGASQCGGASASAPAPSSLASSALAAISDKELTDLQGRLWGGVPRNEHLCLYACVRNRNAKKQLLRIDLRCERVNASPDATVSAVSLRFPEGIAAAELDAAREAVLCAGEMIERSDKVKVHIGLAPFALPASFSLACELCYSVSGAEERTTVPVRIGLPPSIQLASVAMAEDDVASYMAEFAASLLGEQSGQVVSLPLPASTVENVSSRLSILVSRCAGLCNFHAIQPLPASVQPGKGQKFLLVARPFAQGLGAAPLLDGQERMPENALIVCLCAFTSKDSALDIKLTVKSCRKDVSDD
eukprot:CAMPEP_0178383736 /NCGR_PEP_ID=MMETSP0689_2-20121128/7152_1 /TAXON_ID=160604 /ORGANISM="Amphidinium massartii, Strain CS-259" /LENGTH=990 /DNA_ID=CAMNT_0020003959 /DNA_START=114 /DNA_END=3084 /DNA_ORIENTATION=+